MKLVALSLLVLNLAYFTYQQFDSTEVPVRVTKPGPHKGNLTLLSEVKPDDQIALSNVVDNPIRQDQTVIDSADCVAVGPFTDVFTGQSALEQISALEISATLKAVDVATGDSDYRVLIPPASSPEEAFRKLRELQASDVDSYVITQGELALGISLGVFSTSDGAELLQSRLANIGYEAEIIEIERQSRSYWIELRRDEYRLLETANWLADKKDMTNREMICSEAQ